MVRVLSLVTLALTACATPAAVVDDARDAYREPSIDEARAPLVLEAGAPPDAGHLRFVVSIDGREVAMVEPGAKRELFVRPGVVFVDVAVVRDVFMDTSDVMVPERQMVPCGRGRFCERTVLVPRSRPFASVDEEPVCKRGVELAIVPSVVHRVFVSSDGDALCRIACSVGSEGEHDCVAEDA